MASPRLASFFSSHLRPKTRQASVVRAHIERRGYDCLRTYDTRQVSFEEAASAGIIQTSTARELAALQDGGMLVVAVDISPRPPKEKDNISWQLRRINDQLQSAGQPSCVLQALPTRISWRLLVDVFKEDASALESEIRDRVAAFHPPFPYTKTLKDNGYTARVDVVDYGGEDYVCKTFKPGKEEYLQREVMALKRCEDLDMVIDLIDYGSNWLLTPYHHNSILLSGTANFTTLFPTDAVREVFQGLFHMQERGVVPLDFHPANVLYLSSGSVKIFDLEKVCLWNEPERAIAENPVVSTFHPERPRCDLCQRPGEAVPFCEGFNLPTYKSHWEYGVGADFESLMHDPDWRLQCNRLVTVLGDHERRGEVVRRVWAGIRWRLRRGCEV